MKPKKIDAPVTPEEALANAVKDAEYWKQQHDQINRICNNLESEKNQIRREYDAYKKGVQDGKPSYPERGLFNPFLMR